MSTEFINELMFIAGTTIPQKYLSDLKNAICSIVQGYNIEKITTELDLYYGNPPDCYKHFMVTKHIEGASENTLYNYRLFLEDMFKHILKPIEQIEANDIRGYLYNLQKERNIINHTLENRRSVISSFFGWVAAEGYIDKNPALALKPIKYEEKPRQPLTTEELNKVRDICKNKRDRAMVEFLYSTACRVSELEVLNKTDVNFKEGEVYLFGKGKKYRTSFLTDDAAKYLKEYLESRTDDNEALFVSLRRPYNRLHKAGIEKAVGILGSKAKIGNLFPHRFRHTAATVAINNGMPIADVQKFLGHEDISTTTIYAKVDKKRIKENHRKFL